MFTFSSTGPYSKEQIKLLKEMEEKCNLLMKLDKDLFNQKYSHLINFFTPVMWLDIKKISCLGFEQDGQFINTETNSCLSTSS